MLYRVTGTVEIGPIVHAARETVDAPDPEAAIALAEDAICRKFGRCDADWLEPPQVDEIPADQALASIGAVRLPGLDPEAGQ